MGGVGPESNGHVGYFTSREGMGGRLKGECRGNLRALNRLTALSHVDVRVVLVPDSMSDRFDLL